MTILVTSWRDPSDSLPQLFPGQIHLWRFSLNTLPKVYQNRRSLLSTDELARADRLLDPQKQRNFTIARSCLRQLLAKYLDLGPERIDFSYNRAGKPFVTAENRAKLAWYIIDPLFYDVRGGLRPKNVDKNEISKNSVRKVLETELFPNKDIPNGTPHNIPVFNLAFFPDERGPYNYDVDPSAYSAGMTADGKLANPESRWGGIMRKVETSDFESSNIEYIEFWMMDPFADDTLSNNKGELYIDLGDVSEDILRDGRKSYENGLPTSATLENVDTTQWGRVPNLQALWVRLVLAAVCTLEHRARGDVYQGISGGFVQEAFAASECSVEDPEKRARFTGMSDCEGCLHV